MASSQGETGPRTVPVPWDPSYYVVYGDSPTAVGDMFKAEYATNAAYGVVDKALSAYYVPWGGVENPPLADTTQAGLMSQGDGNPDSYYGGDNQLHSTVSLQGTRWWVGIGNPGVVPGSLPGDLYLDSLTGNYFQLS